MPSAALVHAAFFSVGIAIGVSTTVFVGGQSWKKQEVVDQALKTPPVVQVDKSGSFKVSKDVLSRSSEVLPYGHPGILTLSSIYGQVQDM